MSDKAAEPHNSFYYHRINRLARMNRAQSYLEVGVSDGATFFNVEIAEKTAVDPRFRFDAAARATPTQRFHEMTSDAFFALPETRGQKIRLHLPRWAAHLRADLPRFLRARRQCA